MSVYESTVCQWADVRAKLGQVNPYTAKKAREKALLFVPFVAADIDEISPCDIEQALCILGSEGGRDGKGRSTTTLRAAHLAATQAVDWAISRGMAKTNPWRMVPRPKAARTQAGFLELASANQLALFADQELQSCMQRGNVNHAAYCMAVVIALATGMRRGEIFALEWPKVGDTSLMVQQAVKGDGSIGEPKSSAGVRMLAIGENLARKLKEYKQWQSDHIPEREFGQRRYVIANNDGDMANMSTFEHWWARFRDMAGFHGLKFHELRHTHASLLIGNGVDVKTVQIRMGHSSADVTMNVYAHAMPRNDVASAKLIDDALYGEVVA